MEGGKSNYGNCVLHNKIICIHFIRFGNAIANNGWIYLKERKERGCSDSQSECFKATCRLDARLSIADCYTNRNGLFSYHPNNDYCGTWEGYSVDSPKGIRCLA